jgi:hypothetical protein
VLRPSDRSRPLVPLVVLVVALVCAGAGCGRREFEDRTAVVALGGSRQTYEVDACGLDGETAFVVARSADGAIIQAVVGLEGDDRTGVPASSGITVDLEAASEDSRVAGFGAESWDRRGSLGPAPGTITSAKLRGSRIQLSGEVVPVDADDVPVPDGRADPFSLDARCDELPG